MTGDAALTRPGAGGSEAFDELGHIKALGHGLIDVLDRRVFIEADESLSSDSGSDDEFGAPGGLELVSQPISDCFEHRSDLDTVVPGRIQPCGCSRGFDGSGGLQAQDAAGGMNPSRQ